MILLDTNILVHAWSGRSSHHQKAWGIIEGAFNGRLDVCLTPQVLWEFFSVMTTARKTKEPVTAQTAIDVIETILKAKVPVLTPTLNAFHRTLDLVRSRSHPRGAEIFDLFLAATALEHGISQIYTENVKDFEFIDGLEPVNPLA